MIAHVHALAEEIGPRGTGTPGERHAANYVASALTALGLPVERHSFRAVASQNAFPLAVDSVALLGVAIYPLGGSVGRWIAAILALSTAPMLWQAIRTSSSPLGRLLPHVTSTNVATQIRPRGRLRRRAVILAHLDTNRCRFAWQSSAVRYVEPLTWLTLGMLAWLGLLYLGGALLGGPSWVWWVSLVPAGYVLGTVITLWRDDRTPHSPGAHDNAASVAVALEIGNRLVKRPLEQTEVWLAFTGAEETDHAGLYMLLDKHRSLLRQAAFLGLEGVGSGEIVFLTRQGVCAHYRPDPELLSLAAGLAQSRPDLRVRAAEMTMEDEVGTLRRKGYRAMCIAGRDPSTGTLPHWHRADDTLETISSETLERAAAFVVALLDEMDRNTVAAEEEACASL
jgi:acetylornithine deacetylase/succinyl-diaminopimelate desuccinylase-like protein